jgi:hypothetical protein
VNNFSRPTTAAVGSKAVSSIGLPSLTPGRSDGVYHQLPLFDLASTKVQPAVLRPKPQTDMFDEEAIDRAAHIKHSTHASRTHRVIPKIV